MQTADISNFATNFLDDSSSQILDWFRMRWSGWWMNPKQYNILLTIDYHHPRFYIQSPIFFLLWKLKTLEMVPLVCSPFRKSAWFEGSRSIHVGLHTGTLENWTKFQTNFRKSIDFGEELTWSDLVYQGYSSWCSSHFLDHPAFFCCRCFSLVHFTFSTETPIHDMTFMNSYEFMMCPNSWWFTTAQCVSIIQAAVTQNSLWTTSRLLQEDLDVCISLLHI